MSEELDFSIVIVSYVNCLSIENYYVLTKLRFDVVHAKQEKAAALEINLFL